MKQGQALGRHPWPPSAYMAVCCPPSSSGIETERGEQHRARPSLHSLQPCSSPALLERYREQVSPWALPHQAPPHSVTHC